MAKLETIEGIGPAMAEHLSEVGITSIERLLEEGATAAGRARIAEASGVHVSRIHKFVKHADLMRIDGVGGEYAELLEASGVDTVPELANRNPEILAAEMVEVNAVKRLVRSLPTAVRVTGWVEQASTAERVVSH